MDTDWENFRTQLVNAAHGQAKLEKKSIIVKMVGTVRKSNTKEKGGKVDEIQEQEIKSWGGR